jgi:hypothetical protein
VLDLSPVFIVGKLVLQQNHRDFLWWPKWIFVTSLSVQCSGLRGFHLASFRLSAVPAHSHAFVGLGFNAGARVLSAAQNRLCRLFLCFAPHPLLTCLPRFLCRHQSDPVGCSCSASRNRWPDVSRSALSVCYFSLTPGSTSARYMSRVGFGSRVRLCPVASSSTASKS